MQYDQPSQIQPATPFLAPSGTAGAPGYAFAADSTSGMYYEAGTPDLAWSVAGTKRMSLSGNGLTIVNNLSVNGTGTSYINALVSNGNKFFIKGTSDSSGLAFYQDNTSDISYIDAAPSDGTMMLRSKGINALQIDNNQNCVAQQNLKIGTVGKGLFIKTGSNAKMGTGTLSGGTATIATTAVTSSSIIFLTDTGGGIANIGALSVGTITNGTSFVVDSTNASDASTFNWLIIEPA